VRCANGGEIYLVMVFLLLFESYFCSKRKLSLHAAYETLNKRAVAMSDGEPALPSLALIIALI
jgi:hypothetical protein